MTLRPAHLRVRRPGVPDGLAEGDAEPLAPGVADAPSAANVPRPSTADEHAAASVTVNPASTTTCDQPRLGTLRMAQTVSGTRVRTRLMLRLVTAR